MIPKLVKLPFTIHSIITLQNRRQNITARGLTKRSLRLSRDCPVHQARTRLWPAMEPASPAVHGFCRRHGLPWERRRNEVLERRLPTYWVSTQQDLLKDLLRTFHRCANAMPP